MKTIEERASLTAWQIFDETGLSHIELSKHSVDRISEIIAEKLQEQKAIDDAELSKLKSVWGNETQVNRRCYIKGYRDAVEKACKWFGDYLFDIGYPDDWMRDSQNLKSGEQRFRKAMEE